MFDIKENLKKLPDKPGVYLFKDRFGQIIYIGKAVSLKNRVRQYFQSPAGQPPKVRAMVANIDEFDYILTDTEMEALILENNLIKKHMPKYNVLLRDDKTFPYIKITLNEEWPRIVKTRRVLRDGGRYFGPYTDAGAVNQIIDLLNRIYPMKKCAAQHFPAGFRPCLNYHIGRCAGICTGGTDRADYKKMVSQATEFLQGRDRSILAHLEASMAVEAQALNFERAAELRDMIAAVHAIGETQKVVLNAKSDLDIVLAARSGTPHGVLFFVRQGRLSGRESYQMQADAADAAEIAGAFIKQYYSDAPAIPKEILIEEALPDQALIEQWLSTLRGSAVRLAVPQRGEKKALLEMARRNVLEMAQSLDERARHQKERSEEISDALGRVVGENGDRGGIVQPVRRIEAYDISNTSGADSVGVMIVFQDGRPKRKDYRRFRIRTIEGPNDYGSLQEVVYRRFKRGLAGDPGFSEMPDLLLIDGGENQVSVVRQVIAALGLSIPVAGMVKDDRHRTRGLVYDGETPLKEHPALYRFIATIQEEVHRFAIGYHRNLRGRSVTRSRLEEIPGIGEKRRNALLEHFGSIDRILAASIEDLSAVPGMNKSAAEKIKTFEKALRK